MRLLKRLVRVSDPGKSKSRGGMPSARRSLPTWGAVGLMLLALLPATSIAAGQTICAGNIPPDGMVITATTTSDGCSGPCRARDTEPARLSIMVICAEQPIPDGYDIEGLTSTSACDCLGDQDNAYVIRRQSGS